MNYSLVDNFRFPDVTLRLIKTSDIPKTVELINPAYSYQDEFKKEPRTSIEMLSKRINEVDFYVAILKDQIVGCVYIEPRGNSLHFGLLTVSDELRGKGLAPAIMKAIEEHATEHGFKQLDLDYMSIATWLKKYYEKYDFKLTGKILKWGNIDLINMSKSIN